ncbi:alpha/beta fold hydrolase [Sphingobacterium deserti]|uniref:Alpha/beta hydrolase fold protein n=1 Tax=Sphingobacterium deserti TaxID=1229276 RepID=A0A0B8T524_9SPHI|nr:alpha/beta hydrolase [Sphingobacterium deserti]KGE12494.1 alpha/beta hydrolase fold protein [Sphingobacterium deserti]
MEKIYQNSELIKSWPGFTSNVINVSETELHYVDGGSGPVLICLPGWPQTWYSYHTIAPQLAKKIRVIVVDIRGMGGSGTPDHGYDKKTMASDIEALMTKLGIATAHILGHDIGGMVAQSLAHNFPNRVQTLTIADGLHPNNGMMQMKLMPAAGKFLEKIDKNEPYTWWMGFNQIKDLPEKLLDGRFRHLLDWLFHYVMVDESKMNEFDRCVYASIYDRKERIRSSNAWYQTFNQDIIDFQSYKKLQMPVLGLASNVSSGYYQFALPMISENYRLVSLDDTGHYMFEENPKDVITAITNHIFNTKS